MRSLCEGGTRVYRWARKNTYHTGGACVDKSAAKDVLNIRPSTSVQSSRVTELRTPRPQTHSLDPLRTHNYSSQLLPLSVGHTPILPATLPSISPEPVINNLREARVDLQAVTHNVSTLKRRIGTPVMAVVKANGYGHGAAQCARAALAGGATWLGVVDVNEALALRSAGIQTPPILAWLHEPRQDFTRAVAERIHLGVSYLHQLDAVAATEGRADVHLKIDTGLTRNGAMQTEWPEVFMRAAEYERAGRIRVRGIFSHLANAGYIQDNAQIQCFTSAVQQAKRFGLTPDVIHLAATQGALSHPNARCNLVRIGIGSYGLSPFDDATSTSSLGLTPAMELSARISAVKRVPAHTGVSYGYSYITSQETTLALVPLGYGDGIPRQASNRASVSINGSIYRVSGMIAMDQFLVDVGNANVKVGDRVILFGNPAIGLPSVADWAAAAGTINYDIVTRIGERVARTYGESS